MGYRYEYEIDSSGLVHIVNLPLETRYVEVPREKRFRKLYSDVLNKIDLISAFKYLTIASDTKDPIIREGMFRIAVVLYIKCFSPAQNGGRSNLKENEIYKGIQGDPLGCHVKYRAMRSKYIAHDEKDFLKSQLGIVLNVEAKEMCGIAYVEKQTKLDYDESIDILKTLCQIAIYKVEERLEKETNNIDNYLRMRGFDLINSYQDMKVQTEPDVF